VQVGLTFKTILNFDEERAMNDSAEKPKSLWNSLEVVKIGVAILTPIALFLFSYQINQTQLQNANDRADNVRKETQERERIVQVSKQRILLWSEISPLMNDLYCYFLYVGHWKEISPEQVIETKRKLDKLIYSNSPFFSPDFLGKYNAFMASAFKTGSGWGADAKLRSAPIREKDKGKAQMFDQTGDSNVDNTEAIHQAYFSWLAFAAKEMDLEIKTPKKPETPTGSEVRERLGEKS
jgi:hypothetical protein